MKSAQKSPTNEIDAKNMSVRAIDFDPTTAPKINFNSALTCFLNAISLMSGVVSATPY